MKFTFSKEADIVFCKLVDPIDYESNIMECYKNPTCLLVNNSIHIKDFGIHQRTLLLQNFSEIDGVIPSKIEDAFNQLSNLFKAT